MQKQYKKQQNEKKVNKKIEKAKESITCNIFAMGKLELTLIIEFKDKDLIQKKEGRETKININDINMECIEKLMFIQNNEDLINRIKLESENDSIKQFLLIKKTSKGNRQIEFFPFSCPMFKERAEFLGIIFKKVTSRYGILINQNSLDKKQDYSIKINLVYKQGLNSFDYQEEKDKETDNEIESENWGNSKKKKDNKDNEGDEDNDNICEEKGLIPKFKRKNCMLRKLKPHKEKYDLIYFNYSDLQKMEGNVQEEDLIELMKFFKKKKSKIFINFYKSDKSQIVEPPDEKDDEENEEENADNNENEKGDNNIGNDINENEEKEDSNEEIKSSNKFSNIYQLNILYNLADIYFFDEDQALELFDKHLKYFGTDKSINKLNKAKIYDYFINSIAGNSNDSDEKIGLFLNNLDKFTIVTCSHQSGTKDTYDSKLYPKITARNIETINHYKAIIQENKDEYYNIFNTLMLGALSTGRNNFAEQIYYEFQSALTIIKKEIECNKNNISINKEKIIDFKAIQSGNKQNFSQRMKEKGFILDCMNQEKSKLKEYVPLRDKNLKWYFRSKSNMKYLKQKGFVDNKGYIMYDKEYRDSLGSPYRLNNKTNNRNSHSLSKVIFELSKNNKISQNYLLTENIRTKEKVAK